MGTTDEATAGKKPWRYYYVMTFPLSSSSRVSREKLQDITEMTAGIEQREEKYLRKVAARNAALAAATEAQRKAKRDKDKPTLASHVAWVQRRLHSVAILLLLVILGVLYALYSSHEAHQNIPKRLIQAVTGSVCVMLVINVGGWVSACRCSIIGAQVLLVVKLGLFAVMVLLVDEMAIVQTSQAELQHFLEERKSGLTNDALDIIINGGAVPSLVQRFIYDAQSIFLQWLRVHCASPKHGYAFVAIDRYEFFSALWDPTEKPCVVATLKACHRAVGIIQAIVAGVLVMTTLQVLFIAMFLAVSRTTAKTFKRNKQPRHDSHTTPRSTTWSSSSLITMLLFRLMTFGTALFGSLNVAVGTDLLYFCSIADVETLLTQVLMVGIVSGLSALFAALLAGCHWKERLASLLLVVSVAFEVFMVAELIKMATKVFAPSITVGNEQDRMVLLGEMYSKASEQTCFSIQRWISHVCVDAASTNSSVYDRSCQREFKALLHVTFNFTESFLAWSIGVKLLLLIQLILPIFRRAFVEVVSCFCCISSRDDLAVSDADVSLKQLPLNFDDAVELYLSSMRSRSSSRRNAERELFEKEWSIRTGRVLADVSTPNVVVTASDFDAIVRTLILRRLTAVCKLDVSLSVADNGKLLVVRIFASDNLIMATLCENEAYCLQFADAIDPGRPFWRNQKEVKADQKVLDAPTAKHKLKLLLKENIVPPKEAVWLPGESLIRVSSRIHALTRISRASKGLIRPYNVAPPFASYSPKIQRQFLYKKYPNRLDIPDTYRRSAVLRTIDCIRLTRRIIDMELNMHATITSRLVTSFHCLHSSSRFDYISRETLASAWITFWRPVYIPGEYWPDEHALLNLVGRFAPFRQPLQSVRDYFGDLIAYYFAWVAFYAKMLMLPGIAAIAVLVIQGDPSMTTTLWYFYIPPLQKHSLNADETNVPSDADKIWTTISPSELGLGLVVIAWGFVFAKLWERKSVWYQLQWGANVSDTSTVSSNDESRHSSNRHGLYKPSDCLRQLWFPRLVCSWLCILVLGSLNLLIVLTIQLAQGEVAGFAGERLAVLSSCVCQAFLMQWNGTLISWVVHTLAAWELPYHSSDNLTYRRSIVVKIFALQLFNTFTGLLILFVLDWGVLGLVVRWIVPLRPLYESYSTRIEHHISVFIEMDTLLIAIFIVRGSYHLFSVVYTTSRSSARRWTKPYLPNRGQEDETLLSPYSGINENYAETIVQLGLVIMFSSVCPLVPLLAFVACSVKLRFDAAKLCYVKQRPEPEGVSTQGGDENDVGLGLWASCMLFMVKSSVPVALALVFFTADNYANTSLERRMGWWFVGVLSIWLVAQIFKALVPRESRLAEEARARNIFVVERYFGHDEVLDQKGSSKDEDRNKRIDIARIGLQETQPSAEQALHHYEERLELLHRLDVALRKRSELQMHVSLGSSKFSVDMEQIADEGTKGNNEREEKNVVEAEYETKEALEVGETQAIQGQQNAEKPFVSSVKDEALQRESEEMIVGYFRPIPSRWPLVEQVTDRVESKEVVSDTARQQQSALSKLFGAAHSTSTEIRDNLVDSDCQLPLRQGSMSTSSPQSAGMPDAPIATEVSASATTENEERIISPLASLRDHFSFLTDARLETTATQASLATQPQRLHRQRASPPPVYETVELAGLEAVREAASRRHFDFSTDNLA